MVTFAGPMVSDFGAAQPSAFTLDHCFGLLDQPRYEVTCDLDGPDIVTRRDAVGRQPGDRRASVRHAALSRGRRRHPVPRGRRRDALSRRAHALPAASRRRARAAARDPARPVHRVRALGQRWRIRHRHGGRARAAQLCAAPVYTGLPFGHVPDKLTLPVGGRCDLMVRDGRATLVLSDYGRLNPRRASPSVTSTWAHEAEKLRAVRIAVFVVEQNIPEELEWDEHDAASVHALAEDRDGVPIGCGRLLPDGHIGRMAVLSDWRGQGVGAALLRSPHRACAQARPCARAAQRADSTRCRSTRDTDSRPRARNSWKPAFRTRRWHGCWPPSRSNSTATSCDARAIRRERALDESRVAGAVDRKHRRAARPVAIAHDEGRRQQSFPFERHAGGRKVGIGRLRAVGRAHRTTVRGSRRRRATTPARRSCVRATFGHWTSSSALDKPCTPRVTRVSPEARSATGVQCQGRGSTSMRSRSRHPRGD